MITLGSIINNDENKDHKEQQKQIFGFELNKPLIDKKDFLLQTSDQLKHKNNTLYANQIPAIKNSLINFKL